MYRWKFLALPVLIAALLSVPRSAPAQVSVQMSSAGLPTWLLRLRAVDMETRLSTTSME
jgi:hypothetical protein